MKIDTHLKARQKILNDLQEFVLGPSWDNPSESLISFNPLNQYATAVLFPRNISKEQSVEYDDDVLLDDDLNDIDEVVTTDSQKANNKEGRNDAIYDHVDEKISDENDALDISDNSIQSRPSSFGLNFLMQRDDQIKVTIGFAKYEKYENLAYVRNSYLHNETLTINSTGIQKIQITGHPIELSLKSRPKDNMILSSLTVSHTEKYEDSDNSPAIEFNECIFHVGMSIESMNNSFQEIKPLVHQGESDDAKSLDLLFRNKKSYAIGIGCASDWSELDDSCKKIFTSFLPTYELPSIEPESNFTVSMKELASIDKEEPDLTSVDSLYEGYKLWLATKKNEITSLEETHQETATKHIVAAEIWLNRIKEGINLIKTNSQANNAFRLMNFAMLIQFNRSNFLEKKFWDDPLRTKENLNIGDFEGLNDILQSNNHGNLKIGSWRPFQIAFVLGIIPDFVSDNDLHSFRDEVDLLWFPTGGGKTEAYLGVLAFSILFRRLKDPADAGITSIMRYTLRLLTSDQFRRCSSLICALDFIRKNNPLNLDLGTDEISIGLWIGSDGSPATHKIASNSLKRDKDAEGNLKFMLQSCPWCKSSLTSKATPPRTTQNNPHKFGYRSETQVINNKRNTKIIIFCPDENCEFHSSLPVYLWEDAVLETKPTLLIGTVDNFAKLAWNHKGVQSSFADKQFSPPELIIQDELHLISGPLGSMVALYENILLGLIERDSFKPKIIGATATLSIAGSQAQSLYNGRKSSIFPPQILDWGDSFFAKERNLEDKPGRMYVGYFGNMKNSMIESAFNAAIPLLQAPQTMLPTIQEDAEKGSTDLKVSWPNQFSHDDVTVSVFHKTSSSREWADYKVLSINKLEEEYLEQDSFKQTIIKVDPPLKELIKKDATLYITNTKEYSDFQNIFDPYGTLIWYFNSKRELADMSNQQIRLMTVLKHNARNIQKGKLGPPNKPIKYSRQLPYCEELTGRLTQDEIEVVVKNLNLPWTQTMVKDGGYFTGVDICFSTNMISVGVDIPRLGVMLMHGQPRTTAEYIQATSRVGRTYPGLVTTIYNHNKSKDRSMYEMFKNYHQSLYRFVESSSITPYSQGARDKGLAAVFIGLATSLGVGNNIESAKDEEIILQVKEMILQSVKNVDNEELISTENQLDEIINTWRSREVEFRGEMGKSTDGVRLLGMAGKPESNEVFQIPLSMRNVDANVMGRLYRELSDEQN